MDVDGICQFRYFFELWNKGFGDVVKRENGAVRLLVHFHVCDADERQPFRAAGLETLARRLDLQSVLKGSGMKLFLDNLQAAMREMSDEDSLMVMDTIGPFLDRINKYLRQNGVGGKDDVRMGNEIMLDEKDFQL
jgi:hypothetical protein